MDKKHYLYADDDYEPVSALFKLRAPSLIVGLLLGICISFVTSNFEEVLSQNVEVAFFLPFIVYIADAIGTQTEAIYTRDLKSGKAKFSNYFKKEFALGALFGIIFGIFSGLISYLWLQNDLLSISVSISCFLTITTAPLVALIIAHTFYVLHKDPAAATGPIATVVQDVLSVVIYGVVASKIIL